mgnify:FL=1
MRREIAVSKGAFNSDLRLETVLTRIQNLGVPFSRNKFEYDGVNAVMGHISVGKDVTVSVYEAGDKQIDGVKRIAHTYTAGQLTALRTMLDGLV